MQRMTGSIRDWRIDRGMNQADLASAIGVTPATISHWEAGRARPRPAHLHAIANALGLTVDEIELPDPVQSTRPKRHYEAWRSRLRKSIRERSRRHSQQT
jgi:transcriptional regulator with XRE-family HTH domain